MIAVNEVIDLNQNGHGSEPFWTVAHVTRFVSKTNVLREVNHVNHLNHPNKGCVCVCLTAAAAHVCTCVCARVHANTCVRGVSGGSYGSVIQI